MKHKFYLGLIALSINAMAQQNPTNTAPGPLLNGSNTNQFWSRGGNQGSFPLINNNNIFGTLWNSPIYTQTNGQTRTRLNGTLTTPINGVNQNVDGYFGIGRNNFFATNSPYSMLHLEGNNNSLFLAGQWRRWMSTCVYMRENADAMYVGLKYTNTT